MATITALNIYPVKSCRGIALKQATLLQTGFTHDRQWLIVRPDGHFITQREDARLALIETDITAGALTLRAPNTEPLTLAADVNAGSMEVQIWKDKCAAFDAGDEAARWLEIMLDKPYRLVRFDTSRPRYSDPKWTGDIVASSQFSDGFPYLVISQASLDDLNSRLPRPLPMNRFRPNIVVDGLPPYGEDQVVEFTAAGVRLRVVKACTRCIITTTDQQRAQRDGDEPLKTLRSYRFSSELRGVLFGQNVILAEGAGRELRVGQELRVD
jgi:uncharacterized protein